MQVQIDQGRVWLGLLEGEFTDFKTRGAFSISTVVSVGKGSHTPLAFELVNAHIDQIIYQPEDKKVALIWFLLAKGINLDTGQSGPILKRMAKIM